MFGNCLSKIKVLKSIELSKDRWHIKFNMDENEAVRDRLIKVLEHVIFIIYNFQNCLREFFFIKMFRQLNNCYVGKQQYDPLNMLYFSPLQH